MPSLGRYPRPRVLGILSSIREQDLEPERFKAELKTFTSEELRQLGREIMKENGSLGVHLDAVRGELLARRGSVK